MNINIVSVNVDYTVRELIQNWQLERRLLGAAISTIESTKFQTRRRACVNAKSIKIAISEEVVPQPARETVGIDGISGLDPRQG